MRIALYGIGGLYNYGCEAIVRGTTTLIRNVSPDAQIRYFTPRAEDDAGRVADLDIEVVQLAPGRRGFPLKVANKIARAFCAPFDSTREDYFSVLDGSDVVASIGGDMYTIPAHLRERKRYPYFNKLVRMGELAQERGIPEIVVGASIGPFGSYAPAVDYYANHLQGVDLICCRESSSVGYLRSIGVYDNVCLMPDPAFFVKDGEENAGCWESAEYLGVNLSPLSLRELNGGVLDGDITCMAILISRLIDESGLPAMLVPHVMAPHTGDNDLLFLRKVADAMDAAHRARTEIVEPAGFLDAKRMLRRCRLAVAARMHCAVNAMCEGIPTILLSYSQKAVGMCEYVYGSDRWVLPLGDAERKLPSRLGEMHVEADEVHKALLRRIREIRSLVDENDGLKRLGMVLSSATASPLEKE